MEDQTHERWFQLCQLAQIEEDPQKLLALVTEINNLLEGKKPIRKPIRSETRERKSENLSGE